MIDQKRNLDEKQFFEQYYDQILPNLKFEEPKVEESTTTTTENVDGEHEEHFEEHQEAAEEEVDEETLHESSTEEPSEEIEQVTHRHHHRGKPTPPPATDSKNKYSAETQALLDQAEAARQSFQTAQKDFNQVKTDIDNIKKKLELDIGSNGEFASLIDDCFEYDDREYTYKLCPYDRTIQKSKSGHGETSIGVWKSWDVENPNAKYKIMRFADGLSCWNGPARSTKVRLYCGVENKIISVTEPNRCEYEMKFETPTACDDQFEKASHEHSEL